VCNAIVNSILADRQLRFYQGKLRNSQTTAVAVIQNILYLVALNVTCYNNHFNCYTNTNLNVVATLPLVKYMKIATIIIALSL
jgi:hypothetical protein